MHAYWQLTKTDQWHKYTNISYVNPSYTQTASQKTCDSLTSPSSPNIYGVNPSNKPTPPHQTKHWTHSRALWKQEGNNSHSTRVSNNNKHWSPMGQQCLLTNTLQFICMSLQLADRGWLKLTLSLTEGRRWDKRHRQRSTTGSWLWWLDRVPCKCWWKCRKYIDL